jgi:hypothetical protein
VRTRHVQGILDAMAKTNRFNINLLKHIKSFLSGIFRVLRRHCNCRCFLAIQPLVFRRGSGLADVAGQ